MVGIAQSEQQRATGLYIYFVTTVFLRITVFLILYYCFPILYAASLRITVLIL
jgi:hypothetical protein